MKTVTVHIRPLLPSRLQPLWELARNLWWSWNPDAVELFRRMDRERYYACGSSPLALLNALSPEVFTRLAEDGGFLDHLASVHARFRDYLVHGAHVRNAFPAARQDVPVAYFSMEFGLHESIPLYAGGLGVLAGDHLKAASDMGLPLVGVGLFYAEGYFEQHIARSGWQYEGYERSDPHDMPMREISGIDGAPLRVRVAMGDDEIALRVWSLAVGRVSLLLLDTDVAENAPADRAITARLYAGDEDLRIKQEIVLGIGGARALHAMGIRPGAFHLNEGHSAFLSLERVRQSVEAGLTWKEALLAVSGTQVFTVHTPVPAGNERFPRQRLSQWLGPVDARYLMPDEAFFTLGRGPDSPEEFSMPVFALRTSSHRNGVSRLHGRVSRHLWKALWPQLTENEVPIRSITNGVHTRTWMSNELALLLDRTLGRGWDARLHDESAWHGVRGISDGELWDLHQMRKSRLIARVVESARGAQTLTPAAAARLRQSLRPHHLTLGFARRFATYKRGALMFQNITRLKRLLLDESRPVQMFIAGKAHPADDAGKETIQEICRTLAREDLAHRVVFLENYDMGLARSLVRGVDVWLNTPVRPLEASGTSGMKAAANGALNVSILDGWWDEAYVPRAGWAIGTRTPTQDPHLRDEIDRETLLDLLENEIIPLYYGATVPEAWIAMMKEAIARYGPGFSAQRMMADYIRLSYEPALTYPLAFAPGDKARKEALASSIAAQEELRRGWPAVSIRSFEILPHEEATVGTALHVRATVKSPLPPEQIEVTLLPLSRDGVVAEGGAEAWMAASRLAFVDAGTEGVQLFEVELDTPTPEVRRYALRVTPNTKIFPQSLDLHLVSR